MEGELEILQAAEQTAWEQTQEGGGPGNLYVPSWESFILRDVGCRDVNHEWGQRWRQDLNDPMRRSLRTLGKPEGPQKCNMPTRLRQRLTWDLSFSDSILHHLVVLDFFVTTFSWGCSDIQQVNGGI